MENNITPMLRQYQSVKEQYPDAILFFRLGDFYEMFYEDAKTASVALDLVLTSRGAGASGKVPMCGLPYHAADSYIGKLIRAGYKVAVCEQLEDPSQAKGIVKRDVIRVITSGTYLDDTTPDARCLLALLPDGKETALAFTDTVGGSIQVCQCADAARVLDLIAKLPVYECIFPASRESEARELLKHLFRDRRITASPCEDWYFNREIARKTLCDHFHVHSLAGFGIEEIPAAQAAAGALLEYLRRMNRRPMLHIDRISLYADDEYMYISPAACFGLELDQLIKALDHTGTAMGRRLFRFWFYHPLKEKNAIEKRQDAVRRLKENAALRDGLDGLLDGTPDVEKSVSRVSCGCASPRDLLALRGVLLKIPQLRELLDPASSANDLFTVDDVPDLRQLLEKAVNPSQPLSNPEGHIIRPGYNAELDGLKDIQENGRQWLKELQAQEIKRTGINSLKIGYTGVFGYYLEVSKPNLSLVPVDFIRKQTLVNAERFITPQLKEFEEKMLTADEKVLALEREIVRTLYERILERASALHRAAASIAVVDVLRSLAVTAQWPGYCLPEIDGGSEIVIKEGRHPTAERMLEEPFVPNDTLLDCDKNRLLMITGPNMAGKSTYIRQTALLAIMAQTGSYIPAASAKIGLVDKVFTRIGARDEISKGQSTFMVEMNETAGILHNLSERSLVVLDEVGRGTSTYDGLCLAWAVAEYLQKMRVRTLFATHFHELTALAERLPGVKNYNVAVKEWKNEVVFLHKIMEGGTDDSYGIYVAKLAGIPAEIIRRSEGLLARIEMESDLKERIAGRPGELPPSLFTDGERSVVPPVRNELIIAEEIALEIAEMDVNSATPLEALNKIGAWKAKLKK